MSKPDQIPNRHEQMPIVVHPDPRSYAEMALALLAILALLAVTCLIVFSRARYGGMIEEFETHVPLLTRCTLSLAFPMLSGALILVTLAKEFVPSWRRAGIAWNVAMLPLAIALLATYVAGILIPFGQLTIGLSK